AIRRPLGVRFASRARRQLASHYRRLREIVQRIRVQVGLARRPRGEQRCLAIGTYRYVEYVHFNRKQRQTVANLLEDDVRRLDRRLHSIAPRRLRIQATDRRLARIARIPWRGWLLAPRRSLRLSWRLGLRSRN